MIIYMFISGKRTDNDERNSNFSADEASEKEDSFPPVKVI